MRFQYKLRCPVVFEGTRYSFQLPGEDSDSLKSGFVSALKFTKSQKSSETKGNVLLFGHVKSG